MNRSARSMPNRQVERRKHSTPALSATSHWSGRAHQILGKCTNDVRSISEKSSEVIGEGNSR